MTNPDFVYTTYIKTTPEKVWQAITNPEFSRQYWVEHIASDWKKGSTWQMPTAENKPNIIGEVLESKPPKLLVLTWVDVNDTTEASRVTFEIEQLEDIVRLNVVHGDFKPGSIMQGKISQGWPRVLAGLKSLLETGQPLSMKNMKSCDSKAA